MLNSVIEAERAARAQDADCARINGMIRLAEQDIAALERRQVHPDEMRKQWSAIRDRTISTIRDVRHNVVRRAHEAEETETWLVKKLLREETNGRDQFSADLQQVPTKKLLNYLSCLIEVGDLAQVNCVRMAFAERPDRQKYAITFDKMLAKLAGRQSRELSELLSRIYRSAEQMDTRIANLLSANRSISPASTADRACPSKRESIPEGLPSVLAR